MAFLITKELIFGFQILDLKDHFSASSNHQNNLRSVLNTVDITFGFGEFYAWAIKSLKISVQILVEVS